MGDPRGEKIGRHNRCVPQFHGSDIIRAEFIWCVCLEVCELCYSPPRLLFLYADHPAKGGVAGVQLSSGCGWALHLHSGGT